MSAAPNAPNIAGIYTSDASTKTRLAMAPSKHAAPMAKQTMPKAIFTQPIIAMAPDRKYVHSLGDSNPYFRREREINLPLSSRLEEEKMKRPVLAACACLMSAFFLAAPVAAQTGTADTKSVNDTARAMVEDRTRQDFEQAKSKLSRRDKDTIDAVKTLFYNKAYIYYACVVSIGREKFSDKAMAECVQEPMKELMAGLNRAKEESRNPKAEKCETSARLVKAEKDFPPYDFLAGEDVQLFDFKALRISLTSRRSEERRV